MKTRSSFEICAPLGIFVVACTLSLPTRIVAVAWMVIGVCSLGYRALDDFPADGIHWKWLRGRRRACLHFYHLAWWPWYMREELHEVVTRAWHRFAPHKMSRGGSATSPQRKDVKKR
jgi:hypothetical protein